MMVTMSEYSYLRVSVFTMGAGGREKGNAEGEGSSEISGASRPWAGMERSTRPMRWH